MSTEREAKWNSQGEEVERERRFRPEEEYQVVESDLRNLSPDSEYLIEERQVSEDLTSLEVYEVRKGKIQALGRARENKFEKGRVLMSFMDRFLEPTHMDRRDCKTERRMWRASGKKAEALRELFTTDLDHLVRNHGWKGLKEIILRLRSAPENLLKFDELSPPCPLKPLKWLPNLELELTELEGYVAKQASEHETQSIEETIVALSLKSEDFVEEYRKVKNRIDQLESSFSFLLSRELGKNDHETF